MKVGKLTIDQKESIKGQIFQIESESTFEPVEDYDGNWIICDREMEDCNNPEFLWVRNLPLIDWKSKLEIKSKL